MTFTLVPVYLKLMSGTWEQSCVQQEEAEIIRLGEVSLRKAYHLLRKIWELRDEAITEATGNRVHKWAVLCTWGQSCKQAGFTHEDENFSSEKNRQFIFNQKLILWTNKKNVQISLHLLPVRICVSLQYRASNTTRLQLPRSPKLFLVKKISFTKDTCILKHFYVS